jgi:hypothetical protein
MINGPNARLANAGFAAKENNLTVALLDALPRGHH